MNGYLRIPRYTIDYSAIVQYIKKNRLSSQNQVVVTKDVFIDFEALNICPSRRALVTRIPARDSQPSLHLSDMTDALSILSSQRFLVVYVMTNSCPLLLERKPLHSAQFFQLGYDPV